MVGQEGAKTGAVGARQEFVKSAGEQVGGEGAGGVEFVHGVETIIEVLSGLAVDGLLFTSTQGVILEASSDRATDGGQLVAGVPGVGVKAITQEVAVGVVDQRSGAPGSELVVGVIGGGGLTVSQSGGG